MVEEREDTQAVAWRDSFISGNSFAGEQLAGYARTVLVKRLRGAGLDTIQVEDAVQECLTAVFRSLGDYNPSAGPMEAWLSGFAKNTARSFWRGAYSRKDREAPLELTQEFSTEPEIDLSGSAALEVALGELHPIDQELLQMRFGQDLSFDEIATQAGITCVNARKRVSRAVEVLRRCPELRTELGLD